MGSHGRRTVQYQQPTREISYQGWFYNEMMLQRIVTLVLHKRFWLEDDNIFIFQLLFTACSTTLSAMKVENLLYNFRDICRSFNHMSLLLAL